MLLPDPGNGQSAALSPRCALFPSHLYKLSTALCTGRLASVRVQRETVRTVM